MFWFEPCKLWYGGWLYPLFKKETVLWSWKAKAELSAILVDKSDAVNPFTSPSDEEDVNEEMTVIEDKTDEEIIM